MIVFQNITKVSASVQRQYNVNLTPQVFNILMVNDVFLRTVGGGAKIEPSKSHSWVEDLSQVTLRS